MSPRPTRRASASARRSTLANPVTPGNSLPDRLSRPEIFMLAMVTKRRLLVAEARRAIARECVTVL
jgi:hypothetical protein